jgi:pyrroline-5-carboxylate reductase
VLDDIKQVVADKKPLIISVVATAKLAELAEALGATEAGIPIIRLMPNLNAAVCEGMTALCANEHVSAGVKQTVLDKLNRIGSAMEIDENMFQVFSAIAGCSPAFTFLFIDSLAKGALKLGMYKKEAIAIAAQAVLGSAKMLAEAAAAGEHPWTLIDRVCTPAGATIQGVCKLEERGFESAVVAAVETSGRHFT